MYRDNFWTGLSGYGGHRARRGDMAPIILNLLLEKPMHGYEIISHLENKSNGLWRPSAGSIYPNLQMLEEQGFITSQNEEDKKIYSLTDSGRKEAEAAKERFKEKWHDREAHAHAFKDLKTTFFSTMDLLKDISVQNSTEKNAKAQAILNKARDDLAALKGQ
jgi:DNA-binding PadR family transcriptional regulator